MPPAARRSTAPETAAVTGRGRLTAPQVRQLSPAYEARRILLVIPVEKAPTAGTHTRIMSGLPIQTSTLRRIDEVLQGDDGEWPPGTALSIATKPLTIAGDAADADEATHLILEGVQLLNRIPGASPDQRRQLRAAFDSAWSALAEQRAR